MRWGVGTFVGTHFWRIVRCLKLRRRLAVIKTKDATHKTTSVARRYVALGNEMPMPVARATYAATHAGHFGSRASVALGTIQPAISPPRRNRDSGRRVLSLARVWIWQQWPAFMRQPPPRGNTNRPFEEATRIRRGDATRCPSRCVPWERGRAIDTCPRGRPTLANRRNKCGR